MAYKVIFAKGEREDISTREIKVDCDETRYFVVKGGGLPKVSTIAYVRDKCKRLTTWLRGQGVYWDHMLEAWEGKPEGYKYYMETVNKVELTCQLLNITCDAMINPALKGLDGYGLMVNGQLKQIVLEGRYIKFHRLIKPGNKYGTMVNVDYDFGNRKFFKDNL